MNNTKWMPLDYYAHLQACTKAARAITGNPVMQVELDPDVKVPHTDGVTIKHYQPHYGMSQEEWVSWYGVLYHEIGHSDPDCLADFDVMRQENIDTSTFEGLVFNLIADYCQERNNFDVYAGRRKFLSEHHAYAIKSQVEGNFGINRPECPNELSEKLRQALEVLIVWETRCREDWMHTCEGLSETGKKFLKDQSLEWLDTMISGDYGWVLDNDCNVEEHGSSASIEKYKLSQRIMDEVFKLNDDEKKATCTPKGHKSSGEPGETQKQDDTAPSKDDGESSPGEQDTQEMESPAIKYEVEIDYEELMKHTHDSDAVNRGYGVIHINYDAEKTYEKYHPYAPHEIAELDFWSDVARGAASDRNKHRKYRKLINGELGGSSYKYRFQTSSGTKLSKKLQRLFKIKARSNYVYGQKKGKLHAKNLYRTALNIQGYSDRIFKKKIVSDIHNTAVSVLLDCSGSMSGDKFEHGGTALLLLSELLQSIDIQHELLGFTDWSDCVHYIFKPFGKFADINRTRTYLKHASTGMSSNADGDSILWATNRLRNRPELLKILIVLSDGQPAGGKGGDIDQFTRDVVMDIERDPTINIYGIGIKDRNVHRIYKECRSIREAHELEDALLDVIRSKIL